MKQIKILLTLLSLLLAQPTFGMEKSVLFTVDLEKLLKLSDPGKSIILANNMARQALQNENEKLETELLSEEKEISTPTRKKRTRSELTPSRLRDTFSSDGVSAISTLHGFPVTNMHERKSNYSCS